MKIRKEDQNKLIQLINASLAAKCVSIEGFISQHKQLVAAGQLKPIKCAATHCFSYLIRGEVLDFVCQEIYKYANDAHLATFYRKMYS